MNRKLYKFHPDIKDKKENLEMSIFIIYIDDSYEKILDNHKMELSRNREYIEKNKTVKTPMEIKQEKNEIKMKKNVHNNEVIKKAKELEEEKKEKTLEKIQDREKKQQYRLQAYRRRLKCQTLLSFIKTIHMFVLYLFNLIIYT